jgi:2-polyprenyl-6-methoxyphenol hydroxylase-like FAD-dependent oxidoreductase
MTAREETDVLVVGAGPAGSATAAWLARLGVDVLLTDAAVFPRDKTCGDGLTPRAIGAAGAARPRRLACAHTRSTTALRAHGFGQTLFCRWPGGTLPDGARRSPAPSSTTISASARSRPGARALDGVRVGRRTTRRLSRVSDRS